MNNLQLKTEGKESRSIFLSRNILILCLRVTLIQITYYI